MGTRVSETAAITEPSDIQQSLGISGYTDYAQLMTHQNINPECKNKPYDSPAMFVLTASERKNHKAEQGIYWGLKIATVGGNWKQIHDCDCSYVSKPTGGINVSPFRPSDFRGHSRDDKFTLTGSSSECDTGKVNYSGSGVIGFLLNWDNYNTHYKYGVNPYECCNDGSNLSGYILCVAVGNYVTAMINGRKGNTYAAIGAVGESKEFQCNLPDELKKAATHPVTFFLANPNDLAKDIRGTWRDISNETISGTQAIAIPGGHYPSVQFVSLINQYGEFQNITVGQDSQGYITASAQIKTPPTEAGYYKIRITFNGGNAVDGEARVMANQTTGVLFTRMENPMLISGDYTWSATISRLTGSGGSIVASITSATGSLSITVQ